MNTYLYSDKKLRTSAKFKLVAFHARAKEVENMLGWALTFLIIAIIAGVLGFTGIAGTATHIAWILFVVFLAVAVISFLSGRRSPLV